LARELLGSHYKDAVLELNASDARGIDVRGVLLFFFSFRSTTSTKDSGVYSCAQIMYYLQISIWFLFPYRLGGTESNQKFCYE
jgi:DNA polymerase III delta prime subunit